MKDYVERNYKILEDKMIEQMENALEYGRELIDRELDMGILNVIAKPVIKSFYDRWCDKDAKVGTLKQIKVTLDCGKELLKNGASQESFNNMINENFQEYLEGDQTYLYCSKNHKNFPKLKEITKKSFESQVRDTMKFLKIQEEVENYGDLTRAAFKTKKEAYDALSEQLDYNDQGIKIVEKDSSILNVPAGKSIIIKILRKGFNETKRELINNLDSTYN
ncbi:MAG: hypothetical protein GF317_05410 [Candidatus Lokiarchaeota archaeon]|nr:hypothetical protein [Candidatus Lokiarchaeota archaeon]MBD3199245.1 hypothetical protein [Candidatus Lokiarchaeota archaeon]